MDKGSFANVEYRAVELEHLRQHPHYAALPEVHTLGSWEEIRNTPEVYPFVRQGTEEWDALHEGHLTTSHLASVLGLYETKACKALGCAPHMASHSRALDSFKFFTQKSVEEAKGGRAVIPEREARPDSDVYYKYSPSVPARTLDKDMSSADSVRLMWGKTQEATAVLAVLDRLPAYARLEECGMYTGPRVGSLGTGASPDGVIRWQKPDGTVVVEALEVKCHSPFMDELERRGCRTRSTLSWRPRGSLPRVLPVHYLQAQFEMLALGEDCRSCLLFSLSSCFGASVYRIDRDDDIIADALHFIERFDREFIQTQRAPPVGFFGDDARHRSFVSTLRANAEMTNRLAKIDESIIQRGPEEPRFLEEAIRPTKKQRRHQRAVDELQKLMEMDVPPREEESAPQKEEGSPTEEDVDVEVWVEAERPAQFFLHPPWNVRQEPTA